jgi:hypothetical protein
MTDDARKHSVPADLVAALVGDLAPVQPVRLARTISVALVLEAGTVLLTAWLLGAQVTGAERLADPMFVGLLLILASGAVASAITMAKLSIPGRIVAAGTRVGVLAVPVLVAALVVAISPWGGTWKGLAAVCVEGFGCTRNTVMIAAPAWLVGTFYLRRLAPLDPFGVGLFSACAALLLSALAVQMACPSCDSWHLAVSHYAPILLAALAAALLSIPILRLRR